MVLWNYYNGLSVVHIFVILFTITNLYLLHLHQPMLNSIKSFFETHFQLNESPENTDHQLKLASAALLIEMMQQDGEVHDQERQTVRKVLAQKFQLTETELHELYELAKQEAHQATDYHQFTRLIAEHYSLPEKIKLVELLWQVAYADGHLDKYEEHMVRRIADLIYVSHADFMQAKHRVVGA